MIERKQAVELMRQFGGMPQTPTDPKEIDLRTKALQTHAKSSSHAVKLVEGLVERLTFFPTVADIAQAAANTADPASAQARYLASQCPHCHGDGYVSVDGEYGISAAVPCDHSGKLKANLGPKMAPSVARQYAMEQRVAEERRAKGEKA